jgi:hypothetical protein
MLVDSDVLTDDPLQAVERLAEAFDIRSIRHALIGGLAFVLRGRPMFTRDIAFLLEVPQLVLPTLLDDIIERGFALDPANVIQQYVQEHVASFRFGQGRINWLKPVLPVYARTLTDAESLEWREGRMVRVATAEGLILTLMVSFRPQDQIDIETLFTANRDEINIDLIRQEWSPYAAIEVERTAWLEAVIARRVFRRE